MSLHSETQPEPYLTHGFVFLRHSIPLGVWNYVAQAGLEFLALLLHQFPKECWEYRHESQHWFIGLNLGDPGSYLAPYQLCR